MVTLDFTSTAKGLSTTTLGQLFERTAPRLVEFFGGQEKYNQIIVMPIQKWLEYPEVFMKMLECAPSPVLAMVHICQYYHALGGDMTLAEIMPLEKWLRFITVEDESAWYFSWHPVEPNAETFHKN